MSLTGNAPQSEITVGQRIGRGMVTRTGLRTGRRNLRAAELICDCGTVYVRPLVHLRRGEVQSCGCLRRERGRVNPVMTRSTHGLAGHPLYSAWLKMLDRCENPRAPRYRDYGARGIRVCAGWHDVAAFIADVEAEIGPRPEGKGPGGKPLYSLDRVNNDGNYESGNIRWADDFTQARNRRPRRRAVSASLVVLSRP